MEIPSEFMITVSRPNIYLEVSQHSIPANHDVPAPDKTVSTTPQIGFTTHLSLYFLYFN